MNHWSTIFSGPGWLLLCIIGVATGLGGAYLISQTAADRACASLGLHYDWSHNDAICTELRFLEVKP